MALTELANKYALLFDTYNTRGCPQRNAGGHPRPHSHGTKPMLHLNAHPTPRRGRNNNLTLHCAVGAAALLKASAATTQTHQRNTKNRSLDDWPLSPLSPRAPRATHAVCA